MSNASKSSGGITFTGALTLLFIGLKLTGYIKWSWWLVLLSPMWVWAAFWAVVVAVSILGLMAGSLIVFIVEKFEKFEQKRRRKS